MPADVINVLMPEGWDDPVKCRHCEAGYRHRVGNCVLCGCGPAPFKIEPLPVTDADRRRALAGIGVLMAPDTEASHKHPSNV